MTPLIPFADLRTPYLRQKTKIDSAIQGVLDHGQFIMGPEVAELESRLARMTGTEHCVTVSSGTEALIIALMALGVGPGDEVITSPFTFVATAEAIALVGATAVFVDIEPDTCNIDSTLIERAVTARTKAIMPVSLYGQVSDMDEINAIASRHGIAVVEDAAQSFGAGYRGKSSCSLSTIACTSFFPSKPLGCYGDGGAIFSNDAELAKAMREIRVHGQSKRYVHTRIGVGGRMDTLQCAIVLAKLDGFADELAARQRVASRYRALLEGKVSMTVVRPDRTSACAQFTVFVKNRDAIATHLMSVGIPTAVHYPVPLHRQLAYQHITKFKELPVAEARAAEVLSLPMHGFMDEPTQDRICSALSALIGPSN
jgi:UDP-2-acetamido-2-deoxy-ribo-hexuluronate aminotransferase